MKKNSEIIDISNMKMVCYIYGIFNWVAPFLIQPEIVNTIYSVGISFISTCLFIYIMLKFKGALNNILHSVKMDKVIGYLIYFSLIGYALNILALRDPQGILPYQAMLGIGVVILYIVYGFFLKNLDAPLEKLSKVKSINIYANCVLISVAMAFTIIGVIFFIILMGVSYFILGNIFVELEEMDLEEDQ